MRFLRSRVVALVSSLGLGAASARVGEVAEADSFLFQCPCQSEDEFWAELSRTHGVERPEVPFQSLQISPGSVAFELELVALDGSVRQLSDSSCQTLIGTAMVIIATAAHAAAAGPMAEAPPPPAPPDPPPPPALPDESARPEAEPTRPAAEPVQPAPEPVQPEAAVPSETGPVPILRPETPTRSIPRTPQPARREARRTPLLKLRPLASVGAGLSLGFFPNPAFFAEASAGVRAGTWAILVLARYSPATESQTASLVPLRMEAGGARLSVAYFPRSWLRLELGQTATLVSGRAVGIARPAEAQLWALAPELDIVLSPLKSTQFALETGMRGWATLNSPRFELDSGDEVFQVPRAGFAIFFRGNWQSR